MPWFDFDKDPGRGNLNLRAYFAAVIGPKRVAQGQRSTKRVLPADPTLLAKNAARGHQVMYVDVWLPSQYVAAGARVRFDSSGSMGETADLVSMGAFGNDKLDRYTSILLPNEQLYAQVVSDAGGNPLAEVSLVVSMVTF